MAIGIWTTDRRRSGSWGSDAQGAMERVVRWPWSGARSDGTREGFRWVAVGARGYQVWGQFKRGGHVWEGTHGWCWVGQGGA